MILKSPNFVTFPIYLWKTLPYPFGVLKWWKKGFLLSALSISGFLSFEFQVIWRCAFCVIDLQLLKTMKIANVQIFMQKRGLASNFFSWVLSNISRELNFWISGHLEVCILCNWSPTFENHENCKCANLSAKKGVGPNFFPLMIFIMYLELKFQISAHLKEKSWKIKKIFYGSQMLAENT